jgi:hypothetical protein
VTPDRSKVRKRRRGERERERERFHHFHSEANVLFDHAFLKVRFQLPISATNVLTNSLKKLPQWICDKLIWFATNFWLKNMTIVCDICLPPVGLTREFVSKFVAKMWWWKRTLTQRFKSFNYFWLLPYEIFRRPYMWLTFPKKKLFNVRRSESPIEASYKIQQEPPPFLFFQSNNKFLH